jgi:hypothetical protein
MAAEQKPLFTPPAPTGNLTIRQRFVYDELIRIHRRDGGGADADEIGAKLHERRKKHPADKRCNWCAADGQGALEELRSKGLAKKRRMVGWVPLHAEAAVTDSEGDGGSYDPATAEIPF